MAEPSLIRGYRGVLAAELPERICDEILDGLAQTHEKYLSRGLGHDAAALAAVAEFGDPRTVIEAFSRESPYRACARWLLRTGPVVGICWGAVLVTGRAWTWAVPIAAAASFGLMLLCVIGLLATATLCRRYRRSRLAGIAACCGLAAQDAAAISASAVVLLPGVRWFAVVAVVASAVRLVFVARALVGFRRVAG